MSDREKLRAEIERLEDDNKRLEQIVEREMRKMNELKIEQGKVFSAMQKDRDHWLEESKRLTGELEKLQGDYIDHACRWKTCPIRRPV